MWKKFINKTTIFLFFGVVSFRILYLLFIGNQPEVTQSLSYMPYVAGEELHILLCYGFLVTLIIRLIVMLICMAIAYALAPDPKEARSATLDDVDVPTAEVGRALPVIFGTKLVKGANAVWFGDFLSVAFKK